MLHRAEPPIDIQALITRNLIEIALWCEYVSANCVNMQRFSDEVMNDVN